MPKGHYTTAERQQWTPESILAAIAAFEATTQRLPRMTEFVNDYGLPSWRPVARLYGSKAEALAAYREAYPGLHALAPAWNFGQGCLEIPADLGRRAHG